MRPTAVGVLVLLEVLVLPPLTCLPASLIWTEPAAC